jgi:hypothetical protein
VDSDDDDDDDDDDEDDDEYDDDEGGGGAGGSDGADADGFGGSMPQALVSPRGGMAPGMHHACPGVCGVWNRTRVLSADGWFTCWLHLSQVPKGQGQGRRAASKRTSSRTQSRIAENAAQWRRASANPLDSDSAGGASGSSKTGVLPATLLRAASSLT